VTSVVGAILLVKLAFWAPPVKLKLDSVTVADIDRQVLIQILSQLVHIETLPTALWLSDSISFVNRSAFFVSTDRGDDGVHPTSWRGADIADYDCAYLVLRFKYVPFPLWPST
jgi:hypothetical protein